MYDTNSQSRLSIVKDLFYLLTFANRDKSLQASFCLIVRFLHSKIIPRSNRFRQKSSAVLVTRPRLHDADINFPSATNELVADDVFHDVGADSAPRRNHDTTKLRWFVIAAVDGATRPTRAACTRR